MSHHGSIRLALALCLCAATLAAQTVTGALEGSVQDPSGGLMPNVKVTLWREETGFSRTAMTNEAGLFRADQLPVGFYQFRAAADGFAALKGRVEVAAAGSALLKLVMQPGRVEQSVEVAASAVGVELMNFDMSRGESGAAIQDLPVLDRDVISLVALSPGVPAPNEKVTNDPTARRGAFNIGGTRWRNVIFNIDGTDNNDDRGSGTRASVIQESVQEMRVLTNVFSAQYGRGGGGVVDVILKSGTNQFHGAIFENFRNEDLNANDFFNNRAGLARPGDKRNEWGGVLGGPVIRNRTFFFAGLQGNNIRLSRAGSVTVIPDAQRVVESLAAQGGAQVVSLIQSYYKLLPPSRTGIIQANIPYPFDGYNWSVKIDHKLSDKDWLELRYFDRKFTGQYTFLIAPGNRWEHDRDSTLSGTWRCVFSPRAVNEFKASYLHLKRDSRTPDAQLPDVAISGFQTIGNSTNQPALYENRDAQFADNFSFAAGRHMLKAGTDIRWKQLVGYAYFYGRGVYTFGPTSIAVPGYSTTAITNFQNGLALTFNQGVGDFERDFRTREYSFYLQDDWRLRPNLTLNLGVRYEIPLSPDIKGSKNGQKAYVAYDPFAARYVDLENRFNYFAPRLGGTWDPFGKGRTSIRGGYGLVYGRMVQDDYNIGAILQPPLLLLASLTVTPALGPIYLGRGPEVAKGQPVPVQGNLRAGVRLPYTHTWSAGVQQNIGTSSTLEVAYVGTASRRLSQQNEFNRFDITRYPYARIDPKQGSLMLVDSTAFADYRSLQAGFRQRLRRGLSLTLAYTWSKAEDVIFDGIAGSGNGRGANGSSDASESSAAMPTRFDPVTRRPLNEYEKGPAIFDRPHAFTASFVYRLPRLTSNRVAGAALHNWSVSGIATYQSGIPCNVLAGRDLSGDYVPGGDRPDIVDRSILGRVYRNPDEVMPRTAFSLPTPLLPTASAAGQPGTFGSLPRNAFRRDGVHEWDLSVVRQFPIRERVRLEFRGEFFNAFNTPQFNGPVINLVSTDFGRIRSTANTPRNIRFVLKLHF
jgi:hypothetical protein